MPTRIKPSYDLGPCKLNLHSIQKITSLVSEKFPNTVFSATDGIWEVYDEERDSFLSSIGNHSRLDSFSGTGERAGGRFDPEKRITIIFDEKQARINLTGAVEDEQEYQYLLGNLKSHLGRPGPIQLMGYLLTERGFAHSLPAFMAMPLVFLSSEPYSKIVLKPNPPNAFLENIFANLASNVIWIFLGAAIVFLAQRLFNIKLSP